MMLMAAEHLIDVRELAAPEPLQRILPAIDALGAGEFLHVVHRREPNCLYQLLEELGFAHRDLALGSRFDIWIWRRDDSLAALAVAKAMQT
jgi:uncharacterized protein (DUF2249 family)